jgi:hypothetical protein
MMLAASCEVLAQTFQTLSENVRARATLVTIPRRSSYTFQAGGEQECAWIVLDEGLEVKKEGSSARERSTPATGKLSPRESAIFVNDADGPKRLITVEPKETIQELTVEKTVLAPNQKLQDASELNDTLLIAVTGVNLRDVRNLGDESHWKSSRPVFVRLRSGAVAWLKPGMHELKNVSSRSCEFVTVEW